MEKVPETELPPNGYVRIRVYVGERPSTPDAATAEPVMEMLVRTDQIAQPTSATHPPSSAS